MLPLRTRSRLSTRARVGQGRASRPQVTEVGPEIEIPAERAGSRLERVRDLLLARDRPH